MKHIAAFLLALIPLLLLARSTVAAAVPPARAQGFNYYLQGSLQQDLSAMNTLGANWILLVIPCYQDPGTTAIDCHHRDPPLDGAGGSTPQDAQIREFARAAHAAGLRIGLKLHVTLTDGTWSGEIRLDSPQFRRAWFAAFRGTVQRYARLAQEIDAELLIIGAELSRTTKHTAEWRAVIRAARSAYRGKLTYAANHSGEEMRVNFWDDLDLIGVDAYYPLTDHVAPTPGELTAAWTQIARSLSALSHKWHKPILLTEIGYMSRNGTNHTPWYVDISAPVPQGAIEQRDCYEAALSVMEKYPWWKGALWWDFRYDDGTGFIPWGKLAAPVLAAHWQAR